MNKEEIAKEAVKQWEWIASSNSSDLPTLQEVIESAMDVYLENYNELRLKIKELDLELLNEKLNSASLQRYLDYEKERTQELYKRINILEYKQ